MAGYSKINHYYNKFKIMIMKIAIPTNDGVNISNNFFNSNSFKVFTVEKGFIIGEEVRTFNEEDEIPDQKMIDCVSDCDVFILDNKDSIDCELEKESEILIKKTCDIIITNIIVDFKNEQRRIESNYCCCP